MKNVRRSISAHCYKTGQYLNNHVGAYIDAVIMESCRMPIHRCIVNAVWFPLKEEVKLDCYKRRSRR